jgi:hypothetical protein
MDRAGDGEGKFEAPRDEAMAQLGLTPAELTNGEGEVVVIYVKSWTKEVGKDEI